MSGYIRLDVHPSSSGSFSTCREVRGEKEGSEGLSSVLLFWFIFKNHP